MSYKVNLTENEIPREWYNLAADIKCLPPVDGNGQPITPDSLAPVFPMNLIEQEVSQERWIKIPEGVMDLLVRLRPTPLIRAKYLEDYLDTPARIYFKNESVSPAGSHKTNTAVVQAWYNKEFGIKKLTTETGAGQWGSALSYSCALVGLECKIFMVKVSFNHKPFRKTLMQIWGGNCVASPSQETNFGRKVLAEIPDCPGSLGIAISEAIEEAVTDPAGKTRYSLGSVLNHVMLHQTIIGLEAKKQLVKFGEKKVDTIIGCVGGGSNFAGLAFPFIYDKINGANIEIIPVEPKSCPTMTKAPFVYDHGDTARMTPLLPMHSLGHAFVPPAIHAGGLRYHGIAPLVSQIINQKLVKPRAIDQLDCFSAAITFARTEGIVVAPETSHAIAAVIQEANKAKAEGKEKVIIFNLSGHGLLDLKGYEDYFNNKLENNELSDDIIQESLKSLAGFPNP